MSQKVNRLELLSCLEMAEPGLSPKEIVQQSSCFIFRGGAVVTYNDEVTCRVRSPLGKALTGAVQGEPLLAILRKMNEDELDIEQQEGQLLIVGKRRRTGVNMEKDILLPLDAVEKPEEWHKLDSEFGDAIELVQGCAGRDQSAFVLTCVHLHPKWVEACDNIQATRFRIATGISKPTLVQAHNIKHVASLGMTNFSETPSWLHFKNPAGGRLSCRRYMEDYPDLKPFLSATGKPTTLPKGLADAAEKAEIFSSEMKDDNNVLVEIRQGKLRVKGQGASGWYSEVKNVNYSGPSMKFRIPPKMLMEITNRHNECEVSESTLKVAGSKFTFVVCLTKPEEDGKDET